MDMDKNAIIPYLGFDGPGGLTKYYDSVQLSGRLHHIKLPTLFLNAEDDPCFNPELYPFKEIEGASDHLLVGYTKRGGHCGHFTTGKGTMSLVPQQWHP